MLCLRSVSDLDESHCRFKGKRAYHDGIDEMSLANWMTFVQTMYLINQEFTMRKAHICFAISRMGGIDDYMHGTRSISLSFYDWLEVRHPRLHARDTEYLTLLL